MLNSKACIDCKQVKLLSEFLVDKSKKSGYKARCLICGRIKTGYKHPIDSPRSVRSEKGMGLDSATKNRLWAINNKEKRAEINRRFSSNPRNKKKKAIWMRDYRRRNPDSYQNWVARNPDKANFNWNRRRRYFDEANLFRLTRKEVLKLYCSPCFYCGSTVKIQIDHVIPISRGGKHAIGNLVAACKTCNQSKNNKTIMEWRKWLDG